MFSRRFCYNHTSDSACHERHKTINNKRSFRIGTLGQSLKAPDCFHSLGVRRRPWQILIILRLTSSVSGLKTLFWIDSKLHDMKFYLRMTDRTCKVPTSMKLGMETDLNVPAVVFAVYVSLRGFLSAFLFSNLRRLNSVHCLAKDWETWTETSKPAWQTHQCF